MNTYSIILKNKIILRQELDDNIIKNYLKEKDKQGLQYKYSFNIFFINDFKTQKEADLLETYNYFKRNLHLFFNNVSNNYSENDIINLAILLTLKNYNFTYNNNNIGIDFINEYYLDYETDKEIIKWCQEEIKLFKLNLYALDTNNYINGTISIILKDLEEIINNHDEGLINELKDN